MWARVLHFVGDSIPCATARSVHEASALCLADLAELPGVVAYLRGAARAQAEAQSLADAFAAAVLFGHDAILGRHFSARRSVVAEYVGDTAVAHPSLSGFAAWLFERDALQPLVRRGRTVAAMLSFGLVRTAGWQPSWVISGATVDARAQDLFWSMARSICKPWCDGHACLCLRL